MVAHKEVFITYPGRAGTAEQKMEGSFVTMPETSGCNTKTKAMALVGILKHEMRTSTSMTLRVWIL